MFSYLAIQNGNGALKNILKIVLNTVMHMDRMGSSQYHYFIIFFYSLAVFDLKIKV